MTSEFEVCLDSHGLSVETSFENREQLRLHLLGDITVRDDRFIVERKAEGIVGVVVLLIEWPDDLLVKILDLHVFRSFAERNQNGVHVLRL